jgi:hypothetical protein
VESGDNQIRGKRSKGKNGCCVCVREREREFENLRFGQRTKRKGEAGEWGL